MLTKKKLVLVLSDEQKMLLDLIRFEAIKYIERDSEIETVWALNKTPLILESNLSEETQKRMSCVYVPKPYPGENGFIDFCHKREVECGEYMSKERYDTSKDDCFLCFIANRTGCADTTDFNIHTPKFHDIVIYESEHFDVKVELGCIKEGLLMISPKAHIMSAAQIPEDQVEEYETIKRDIEFLLKGSLGDEPVIFFEHGSAPDGFSSHQRSIVHAHVHVAWGVKFPQKYLDDVCLEPMDIKDLANKKYLSYQEGADGEFLAVWNPEVYVQRQYPRQVMGELLGVPNVKTNWRKEKHEDKLWMTFDAWYEYLANNWENLPERIRIATKAFVDGYPLRKKP